MIKYNINSPNHLPYNYLVTNIPISPPPPPTGPRIWEYSWRTTATLARSEQRADMYVVRPKSLFLSNSQRWSLSLCSIFSPIALTLAVLKPQSPEPTCWEVGLTPLVKNRLGQQDGVYGFLRGKSQDCANVHHCSDLRCEQKRTGSSNMRMGFGPTFSDSCQATRSIRGTIRWSVLKCRDIIQTWETRVSSFITLWLSWSLYSPFG